MSILYYILIIIGALVAGFVLAFAGFFMFTYFNDWRAKRKYKKMNKQDLLKPIKIERGEIIENDTATDTEFREFEKLRHFGSRERTTNSREPSVSIDNGEPERSDIPNKISFSDKPAKRDTPRDKGRIKFG